jgi:hypothetical protein
MKKMRKFWTIQWENDMNFKVAEQKSPHLDLLDKVVSMSDRFPLQGKLISILAVLPT